MKTVAGLTKFLSRELGWEIPSEASISVCCFFSSFVFIRFLGDEIFDLSGLIVRVSSGSVPQVKFFKSQECQQREQLCKVTLFKTCVSSKFIWCIFSIAEVLAM